MMQWEQTDNLCPICNAKLWESFDYMDYLLMENQAECRNCQQYFYNYVTGATQIFIGRQEFVYDKSMSDKEISKVQYCVDAEVELLRKEIAP